MARMDTSSGSWLKILMLIVLLVVLVLGGLIWFDYLGLMNVRDSLSPITTRLGIKPRTVLENADDPWLLDKERLKKQQEAIDLHFDEIKNLREDVDLKSSEIAQREDQITEKEKALKEKENSLNHALKQYENEDENLRQSARYLMGMEPEKAVSQLINMDEYDAVNLLRTSERLATEAGQASLVAYWLSLMEPKKSASLQEKLIKSRGTGENSEEQWFNN